MASSSEEKIRSMKEKLQETVQEMQKRYKELNEQLNDELAQRMTPGEKEALEADTAAFVIRLLKKTRIENMGEMDDVTKDLINRCKPKNDAELLKYHEYVDQVMIEERAKDPSNKYDKEIQDEYEKMLRSHFPLTPSAERARQNSSPSQS